MRTIKFRAWDKERNQMVFKDVDFNVLAGFGILGQLIKHFEWQQFTGLLDKNGKEIYEGDILQFSDKREWYRSDLFKFWLQGKTSEEKQQWIDEQPYEIREVRIPDCYEEFSKSDLESAWEVIGNIYENSELITNL